jgi:penicillin-binding protein 2
MNKAVPRARLQPLGIVALLIFSVLSVQLMRMQVLDPAAAPELSSGDQPRVIETAAPRGLIYDRNGVTLVRNVPRYVLRLIPTELPDSITERAQVLRQVEWMTAVPLAELERASSAGLATIDPLVPIEVYEVDTAFEAIDLQTATATLPGVDVVALPKRVYEGGTLLAHILGHVGAIDSVEVAQYLDVGYPLDALVGRSGLEEIYEEALRGEPARRLVVADPTGRELSELGRVAAQPGTDLLLSIDLGLQTAVATALAEQIQQGLPPARDGQPPADIAGAAVVLDVATGDVLAQVSLPSFDANLLNSSDEAAIMALLADPTRPLVDRSYMEAHPPGSTFKTLVAYAALEESIATPQTRITSTGQLVVRDEYNPSKTYIFRDWAAHGTTDLYWGLARSSDVYFYYLSGGFRRNGVTEFEGLGADRLADYATRAGFGSLTGLDLLGETSGLVPNSTWKEAVVGDPWYLGDTYTFGIGQGYLTTSPMQMAVWTAAIANDGLIMEPRLVRGTQRDGVINELPPVVLNKLANEKDSLAIIREAMRITAGPGGTANRGQPPGLTIGGKTGTAEFGPLLANGSYDSHGWYIGFAPLEDPQIAVAVYVKYGVGSSHAAPVARAIFKYYFEFPEDDAVTR